MNRSFSVLILMFAVLAATACEAVEPSIEYQPKYFKGRTGVIDPDSSVYGVKFGSTEAQVLQAFGPPRGAIRISETRRALLYGNSHLFVFRKGRFLELHVDEHMVSWKVSKQMEKHPFFDKMSWRIKPGIVHRMSFGEIRELLKKPGVRPSYRYSFDGERSTTNLSFSSTHGLSGAEAYNLSGFSIRHYGN